MFLTVMMMLASVLVCVGIMVIMLMQQLQHARGLMVKGLEELDQERELWLDTWHRPLKEAHDSLAEHARVTLDCVRATRNVAAQDWLWEPSTSLLLANEWKFETQMGHWVYHQHDGIKSKWQKSMERYNQARLRANASTLPLTRVLASPFARVYAYIVPLPQATVWMSEHDHRMLEQRISLGLSA